MAVYEPIQSAANVLPNVGSGPDPEASRSSRNAGNAAVTGPYGKISFRVPPHERFPATWHANKFAGSACSLCSGMLGRQHSWCVFDKWIPVRSAKTWPHEADLGIDGGNRMMWTFR